MKHLVIIIFLITSLYSHEANCLNMFAVIFDKNTNDENTAKCIEYYIDEIGCDANMTIRIPDLSIRPNLLEYAYDTNKTKTFDTLLLIHNHFSMDNDTGFSLLKSVELHQTETS